MKKFAKVLGVLLLLVVIGVIGVIAVVGFIDYRSEREVVSIVSQIKLGTPFSVAVERLVKPSHVLTNGDEIVAWVESLGTRVEPRIATNAVLHTFVHRGPPFRYILVYTDRDSQKIVHADWCHM